MASQDGQLETPSARPPVPPRRKMGIAAPTPAPRTRKTGHLIPFLGKLGLLEYYPNKLTLKSLLEIRSETVSDKDVESLKDVPLAFLRKLLMVNTKCRNHTEAPSNQIQNRDDCEDEEVNPLDLVTALYLCADSFLQQEMSIKMSMCQFAVPFLLPQPDSNQCTLMLWALRNIYKEWRPHDLTHTKGYVEDSVVHAKIPLISFVRLKDCSFSKSQFINHILGNAQQSRHFIHRDINGGNVPKKIANGLVEISWCLPSGQSNNDVFPQAVAIANLRGNITSNDKQFSFLMHVSTAVLVSMDSMTQEERSLMDTQGSLKSKLFLLINSETDKLCMNSLDSLNLQENHIVWSTRKINMAKFCTQIVTAIKSALGERKKLINIENMSDFAHNLGLCVDECNSTASQSAMMAADKIVKGIGGRQISNYKKKELPLQGKYLKGIAQIEIEECRLQNAGDLSLEKYKTQLLGRKLSLRRRQGTIKKSQTMKQFIQTLSISDKEQRTFFLKWMALKLDRKSHNHLSELHRKFRETTQGKETMSITELDQQLMENSLGIEHYMREIGQIYESKLSDETKHLPSVAADLLLEGYPIELLDGDASRISEKWLTDVLMEVHRKVEECTRLLVVSVLGVQSTGKSTLLNTMFGVQFPVSSGRCTRGAYMLFLSVGQAVREELNCDFVLLIDTEGLKSPELAKLEGSCEHDNQLATLVIGLSDVTIINIAMENSAEMKDILQIAVHAFLRMKKLGKKPVCHFVHQNVSGVSAHSKLITDRKHLLEQLNEMTQIAAGMENQSEVKKFTDVLNYDVEKNNWYVPGLWNGTPPMAPVNSGYSEALLEFKRSLLQPRQSDLSNIPEFLKWMTSLWKSVKHENFIFSFRNTLVAYAYDNLSKEFSSWEWSFRKYVHSWLNNAETQISNTDSTRLKRLAIDLEKESSQVIKDQTMEMNKNLNEYYKHTDRYVNLLERYRADFQINIKSLSQEMSTFVQNKLQSDVRLKMDMEMMENIQKQHTDVIEIKVRGLLMTCKERNTELSDSDLEEAFNEMWSDATSGISPLKERDISASVMKQLHANLAHRRKVQEELTNIGNLTRCTLEGFKVKMDYISSRIRLLNPMKGSVIIAEIQGNVNNIFQNCKKFIEHTVSTNEDYQDIYCRELLEEIDKDLKPIAMKTNTSFEIELKVHICGFASIRFLEMHQNFLSDKNPQKCLEKFKQQYLSDFIDTYRQRDQCLRKAKDFSQLCIKPAVAKYINKSLGITIVDGILASSHSSRYSSRSYFQYTILAELLEKDDFDCYEKYISRYKSFVKKWIYHQVVEWLSKGTSLCKLVCQIVKNITQKIRGTIAFVQSEIRDPNDSEKATVFIKNVCYSLSEYLSLPKNAIRGVLFQMSCKITPFIDSLLQSLDDLSKDLEREFAESTDINDTLRKLTIKPQNVIFERVFGCGEQCPFCKIPCEAGGKDHTQHHATVHRPQGIAGFVYRHTEILDEQLCTTCVYSNAVFCSDDTNNEYHPFKEYHVFYPNWIIAPDPSLQASDYWKYVLVRYNDKFAENFEAKPAVCPEEWYRITKEQALEGLKVAFNVK